MKFRRAFVALGAATLVAAQNTTVPSNVVDLVDAIPTCGVGCLTEAAVSYECSSTNYTCQCEHYAAIQASAEVCLEANCTYTDITTTGIVHDALCNLVEAASVGAPSMASNTTGHDNRVFSNATTTGIRVVDSFTTWCPKATVVTYEDETYTATEPTMLTVTNCPCTVTTTGAAYATHNATATTSKSNATRTTGVMEATKTAANSGAANTGGTSETGESSGESGATGEAGAGGAAESSGESGGEGAAGTEGSSEAAMPTYAQSEAAANHAGLHVGLAVAFVSVFVLGFH
ncbi:hypothetical protein VMCG_04903 [Cytospora schulzeri]|uniref:CFEM domain-containing protein n=1 Tax=Cytospora schulzeri TaxID=448051 RepID=A0A423WN76_9PEZI|nr:hypothetical protein VMCG_04903 [Valsa malicola]